MLIVRKIRLLSLRILQLALLFAMTQSVYAADVLVSELLDTDPATRGGTITYTIEVQNQQNDLAQNVGLSFPLPADTTFDSVDDGDCSHDGNNSGIVSCAFGDLQGTAGGAGDIKTIHVVVQTSVSTANTVSVEATASSTTDTNSGNDKNTQNTTINDGADLFTTLLANPDPVTAGGDVSYSAVVSNNGPNAALAIKVVFQLSVNMTYVTGSVSGSNWSCSYNAGNRQLTCNGSGAGSNLASGANASQIIFKGKVTGAQSGALTTTATVSSNTGDPQPNNDVTTTDVIVTEGTDVAVTISANPVAIIENTTTDVTLAPRNNGPFDAANVEVVYTAPAGFGFQTAPTGNGWSCIIDGGDTQIYHCTRGIYSVGATDNITFTLAAPGFSAGNHVNTVAISTSTSEAVERLTNNSDSLNMTLDHNGVDLSISKVKTPVPVAQNSNMTSTIWVSNHGPLNAASGTITVTDELDTANVTYVSGSGTNWVCNFTSPNVTCTYNAQLNDGASSSNLIITTTATGTGNMLNTATVSYSDNPGDYDNTNNSVSRGITSTDASSASADVQVTKSVNADPTDGDTTTLGINENSMVYTIDIANNGPSAVTGIELTDAIPGYVSGSSGTTGVSISSNTSAYTCSTGSTVSCTQTGSLASGNTDTVEITVSRPLFDGGKTNAASAFSSDNGDPNRDNNRGTADVTIDAVADIVVQSKTVSPTTVQSGVEATYTLSLKNNGPSTATNVEMTDTFNLPVGDTGFTFISATTNGGGSCNGLTANQSYISTDNPALVCNWASIANESTRTVTLKIRPNWMSGSPVRSFQNTVTSSTDTHENNTAGTAITNNSFGPVTLTINPDLIDLLINNSDSGYDPLGHDPASGGDNPNNDVVYDLDYLNRGPSYASGVQIEYTMTPKTGKTVQFMCDEATGADACGINADKCSVSGGTNPVTGPATLTLTCNMPDMVANNSLHLHRFLKFRFISTPDGLGDTHTTNAIISANEVEAELDNNDEAENTSVRGKVDLVVNKNASKATVQVTEPFDWIIIVTNNGPADSFEADLSDTLPANMTFYGATPSWVNANDGTNGACNVSGQDLNCDFGTDGAISNGADVTITVPVMVTNYVNATEQNCASATTKNTGVDPNSSNNTNVCGTVDVINSFFPSDYGDAPDNDAGTALGNYQTRLADSGPRHILDLVNADQIYLGDCVDSDDGSLQSNNADQDDGTANAGETIGSCVGGDDEDGIVIPTLIANQTATLQIEIGGNTCLLDGWIDYNADGDFFDADEQIFTSKVLNQGSHSEDITVPASIVIGNSYARFRCSDAGGLTPTSFVIGGEVEDYLVFLQPDGTVPATAVDYGDAPDTGVGTLTENYQTLPNDNGASHVLGVADAPYLGDCVDSDSNTAQNITATADDIGVAAGVTPAVTTGTCSSEGDDEDGVVLNGELKQAIQTSIAVTASSGTDACVLNAWIDYNQDGIFSNNAEKIANDQSIASGATANLTPTIPANAITGVTYARFRCASSGGLNSTGAAVDGEVEDYQISIAPNLINSAVDFGDAPDVDAGESHADYSTTEANNGPSHVIGLAGAPYLGSCVDSDDGTAQSISADGDNIAVAAGLGITIGTCAIEGQDEDGVSLLGGLNQGGSSKVKVVTGVDGACILNGWVDFNQDGRFSGSEEHVLANQPQSAGSTEPYRIDVPADAKVGETYARFRCSSAGGLGPVGPAPDGEVEDYVVTVVATTSIPTLSEWSLIMLMALVFWSVYRQRFALIR